MPYPQASAAWRQLRGNLGPEDAFAAIRTIYHKNPRHGFLAKDLMDIAAICGEEATGARLILDMAKADPKVTVHPVLGAVLVLNRSGSASPAEADSAAALRDAMVDTSPRKHFFRAIQLHSERYMDAAPAEREPPFCWLPPFHAMRAQGTWGARTCIVSTWPRLRSTIIWTGSWCPNPSRARISCTMGGFLGH